MTTCYCNQTDQVTFFPERDPAIPVVVEFDFVDVAESVSSPQITVKPYSKFGAVDPNPNAIKSGVPTVQGSKVLQAFVGGVDLVDYYLYCQVNGQDSLPRIIAAVLPVRAL